MYCHQNAREEVEKGKAETGRDREGEGDVVLPVAFIEVLPVALIDVHRGSAGCVH